MKEVKLLLMLLLPIVVMAADGVQSEPDYESKLATTRDSIIRHEANLHLAEENSNKIQDALTDYSIVEYPLKINSLRQQLQQTSEQMANLVGTINTVADLVRANIPVIADSARDMYQYGAAVFWGVLVKDIDADKLQLLAIADEHIRIAAQDSLQNHAGEVASYNKLQQDYEQLAAAEQQQEQQLLAVLQQYISWQNSHSSKVGRLQRVVQINREKLDALYQRELHLLARIHNKHELPAEQTASVQPLQPVFAEQKGKLSWPVQGRVRRSESSVSGHDWSGVFIDHPAEQAVHAVSDGRVVFADSFAPIGNMVILDHGDGFMSLYAHEANISRSPGDWVTRGDVIASVDNTGVDNESVLYFEIRQHGNPLNPVQWCN